MQTQARDPARGGRVLGVDVGGTKIAAGVVGPDGEVLSFAVVPTPGDRPAFLAALLDVADRALGQARDDEPGLVVTAAGLGCGGPLDRARGTVSPVNLAHLVDEPLVAHVAGHLGVPTVLENDATAAALGEQRHGAGRGARHVVYLTVSTGIGAGVVVDGRPLRGATGNAAELGHVVVEPGGRPCPCGRHGCLEAYASGTGIASRVRDAVRSAAGPTVLVDGDGAYELAAAVRAGDGLAAALWAQTAEVLGRGLDLAVQAYDPDVVVLGGGVMQVGELLLGPARTAAGPAARRCPFVLAGLGPHVGVVGAAVVARDAFG